ncbi:MAG: hypothetical protein GVY36_11825 [Verrucomicrobia bacterium]|jgi:RHS repeat-associated protein|nr:hypothetical protein [Verrucomicrobiota bacterium]
MNPLANGTTTYHVYAAGQLLYEETGGQITAYHFDSRGSTLALTDSSGTVINRITYGAYGEIVATTTAPTTPFLYNGAYGVQTDENGLLHMRARYYSTELRRFINADPIGFAGGMNWYVYAAGNPISFGDPSGNSPALLLIPLIWWGSTQTANAPGPGDRTTNDTPFVAPAMLASGVGPTVTAGRTIVGAGMSGSRTFMNTLTGPATSASVRNAGTMGFGEATAMTGALARTAATRTSSATLSASQNIGATAFRNYRRFSELTFGAGFAVGTMTDLQPSDANLSMNPFFLPYEAGNLLGGLVTAEPPNLGSFSSGSSGSSNGIK